jgi:large subunit ribosomal protein L31
MKEAIHPDYQNAKIICNCGNVIETRSTRGDFHIEICAQCHPFFTGKQKIMDTAGRIEKFKTRYGSASSATLSAKEEPKKAAAPAPAKKEAPKENRAAKRAKSGKSKAQTAAPAAEAAPAAAEPKAE